MTFLTRRRDTALRQAQDTARRPAAVSPLAEAAGRRNRHRVAVWLLATVWLALAGRSLYLHVFNGEFLQAQGDARLIRAVEQPAARGRLLDRNGALLAISTPAQAIWVNPRDYQPSPAQEVQLIQQLQLTPEEARALHSTPSAAKREFVYVRRQITPELADAVLQLGIAGVHAQPEFRRFYPAGAALAQTLGFTDLDDHGLEGLELAWDAQLRGAPGYRQVISDRQGRMLADVALHTPPKPGQDLRVSLDREISYYALRALTAGVAAAQAKAGSAVVMDTRSGEVLAAVNTPAFDPNHRAERNGPAVRNRAVTDQFEPGSTLKPFTLAAGLEYHAIQASTVINTAPGTLKVDNYTVRDGHNLGDLSLARLLQKSSNVGAAKIALLTPQEKHWELLSYLGFGEPSDSGFPGEAAGVLPHYSQWRASTRAALGYGYGLSVSLLQLTRAYAALANHGRLPPVRFLATPPLTDGGNGTDRHLYTQAMSAQTASTVLALLEGVTADQGTAPLARVAGYRVGGKTGTVHKAEAGGYAQHRYFALFAGVAPLPHPRLAVAVIVDEPSADEHFGGQIAAPIFAEILTHALRLLAIAPEGKSP